MGGSFGSRPSAYPGVIQSAYGCTARRSAMTEGARPGAHGLLRNGVYLRLFSAQVLALIGTDDRTDVQTDPTDDLAGASR